MGAFNSINRPDSPEPSSPTDPVSMSDPAPQTQSEQPQSDPKPSSPEQPPSAAETDANQPEIGAEEEDEDEERAECGFCVFMKGGGCKESFVAWENCVEEAEDKNEDIAQKCFELTSALKDCMLAHSDYYEPILRAEKVAEEQAVQELDREKQRDEEGDEEGVAEDPEVKESLKAEEEGAVVEQSSKAGDEESAGGKE